MVDGQAVRAAHVRAVQADGSEVTTVEGIAAKDGELSPVQSAMRSATGAVRLLHTRIRRVDHRAVAGKPQAHRRGGPRGPVRQFCRCTGYQGIVNAVHRAAELT